MGQNPLPASSATAPNLYSVGCGSDPFTLCFSIDLLSDHPPSVLPPSLHPFLLLCVSLFLALSLSLCVSLYLSLCLCLSLAGALVIIGLTQILKSHFKILDLTLTPTKFLSKVPELRT